MESVIKEPGMITVRTAAQLGKVSEATIWRMLRDGKLKKYRRPGNKRVYLDAEEVRKTFTFQLA